MRNVRFLAVPLLVLFLAACSESATGTLEPAGEAKSTLQAKDLEVSVLEDETTDLTLDVTAAAGEPEITITGQPAHGTLAGKGLAYTYTPAADYSGSDSVKFSAKLGDAEASGTVLITVKPVNDAPSYTPGAGVTVVEDSGAQSIAWATNVKAGPDDESGQTLTFAVTTLNTSLFSVAPTIDPSGTLHFTPAANASGTAILTVAVTDDGGTADSGVDAAPDQTFGITVVAINDAPVFTAGTPPGVLEDAGPQTLAGWATAMSAGPSDEAGQTYAFTITTDAPALFLVAPAVSVGGTLSYTPGANAAGTANLYVSLADDGGTANTGSDTSLQVFALAITQVNDAPSFVAGSNVIVLEDSGAYSAGWATAVSAGPNEAAQTVTFSVTTGQSALFSVQPAVASNGALTFTPAGDRNGVATLTVRAWDNGGTANGGVNVSGNSTLTVTITAVNDAPSFVAGANQTALEDSGAYSGAWATAISNGPADEAGQAVTFSATTVQAALFTVAPAVSATGILTFTPAADANGVASVDVRAWDNGDTLNGGVRASGTTTLLITLTAVNDPPIFTSGTNLTALEDSSAYTGAWATAIGTGAANETADAVTFSVTTAQSALFAVQPAVASDGTLTYTPAANANGVATITVRAWDDGGTANGGNNASGSSGFTITLTAVNDAPEFTGGASFSVDEDSVAYSAIWASSVAGGPTVDENSQTVTFSTATAQSAFFAVQPALASDGTLSFTPAADAFGVATLSVRAWDDGGTANGGVRVSSTVNFSITINAVNDAPSFASGGDVSANEDSAYAAAWASGVSPGVNEAAQAVTFSVTTPQTALFAIQPAVATDGTLAFTPATDANGIATVTVEAWDNGGTALGGVNSSGPVSFTVTVNASNDRPLFVGGGNQSVLEDAGAVIFPGWALGMNVGPSDEAGQTYFFSVTSSAPALFAVAPAVATDGTLTFTPAVNAVGSATIYVVMTDSGGTAYGGVDSSLTQTAVITITPVNDAPSFAKGPGQNVFEDTTTVTIAAWATNIAAGPSDESAQGLTVLITNDKPALFADAPTIDTATGSLRFTLAANQYGVANVRVRFKDDGGLGDGGADTSAEQIFSINVIGVNDPPAFTAGTDVSAFEDDVMQSVVGWATGIFSGALNEAWQTVNFQVTTSTPALFSVLPEVASDGTLKYEPAADANGSALVYVNAIDNGGTAGGGINYSSVQSFQITITPVNDDPTFTVGPDKYALDTAGIQTFTNWATDMIPGPADETAQTYSFTVTNDANAFFSVQPDLSLAGALSFAPATGQTGVSNVWVSMMDSLGASVKKSFQISIDAVNDAPSFTAPGAITVSEDGAGYSEIWATNLSAGPGEAGQILDFQITGNTNPGLVLSAAIAADGKLTFTTAPDANGTAALTVVLHDDGGTAGGGSDTSAPLTLDVTVAPVNDAPSFTDAGLQFVNEDDAPQSVAGFATVTNTGPADESAQSVTYEVMTAQPAMFAVAPAVDPAGTLTYTLAPNANGEATVYVQAIDDGGTANGGDDRSPPRSFTINVGAVNDPPILTTFGDITVDEDSTAGNSGIALIDTLEPGPADESWQTYQTEVTSSNAFLVNCLWTDNMGLLHFCLNWGASGTADIYIRVFDDGGTAMGGGDTTIEVISLTVNPLSDAPTANNDVVNTSVDTPVWIGVTNNDSDPDGYPVPVTLASYGAVTHGTLARFGDFLQYTPDPGYTGPDGFSYSVSDGTLYATANVTIWVGPDTQAPNFLPGSSRPLNGDTLNQLEAYGSVPGEGALNPATFVWDDSFFDLAALQETVTWGGLPLVRDTHYWIEGWNQPDRIQIRLNEWSVPIPAAGAELVYHFTNVKDTFGNVGADVDVGVWYDPTRPQAQVNLGWGPHARLVAIFNEPMDTASASALFFGPMSGSTAIADEINGTGWFSMATTGDAFFFVPGTPFPEGQGAMVDLSGFTDLAGNPIGDMGGFGSGGCCGGPGSQMQIVEVRFVDLQTQTVVYALTVSDMVNGGFVVPQALAGADVAVEVQYDTTLGSQSANNSELRGDEMSPTGVQVSGSITTTTLPDDTLRFNPLDANPDFLWPSRRLFVLRLEVSTPPTPTGNSNRHDYFNFVLQTGASDVTAPTIYVTGFLRGNGAQPIVRPEEPIKVAFSELVHPADLTPAHFSLSGPSGAVALLLRGGGEKDPLQLRADGGLGNPAPLAPGEYTLTVSGIRDTSINANATTAQTFAVTVAPAGNPPPVMLRFATPGTNVSTPLVFTFSDRMSPSSFTDYGPPASRGLLLEELFGATWVPQKGLRVRDQDAFPGALVRLESDGGMAPQRQFRLTWLPGLKNIDGTPAASSAPIVFSTGDRNWNSRPGGDFYVEGQTFVSGAQTLGGMPLESRFSMNAWNNESESWRLTLSTALGEQATPMSTNSGQGIDLVGAQIDSFFAQGLSLFSVSQTDATGQFSSVLLQAFRPAEQTLVDAQPIVTVPGLYGAGTFSVSGLINAPAEAERVQEINVMIAVGDTTSYPPMYVDIARMYVAQLVRNADGSLGYYFDAPADEKLPPLAPPFAYYSATWLSFPFPIATSDMDWIAISVPSAPFIP